MATRRAEETKLVKACLEYLKLRRLRAWRENTGAAKYEKRFVRFGLPGRADIGGILRPMGRTLAIECKIAPNKLTALQKAYLDMIRDEGGVAIVAYSVDDVADALSEEGF